MDITRQTQAILLLTSYFTRASDERVKPLTVTEWSKFALWLEENNLTPADLLEKNAKERLQSWQDSKQKITSERILALLGRGHSLSLALEKWQRVGIWILSRADKNYPKRLKKQLKRLSPPIIFGCGPLELFDREGLAVVGSRNASNDDLQFAYQLGEKSASSLITIISGGARGVDEHAILGALENGGLSVGVLSHGLLNAVTSKKWRDYLTKKQLILCSPFYPEAPFSVGNAMGRNKYIYCLSESALVVHSGKKGGTITGARENLKKGWVPLWVKPTDDVQAGNSEIVKEGGQWCDAVIDKIALKHLFIEKTDENSNNTLANRQMQLFSEAQTGKSVVKADSSEDVFYELFIEKLGSLATEPISIEEIKKETGLHGSQINTWVQRAIKNDYIKEISNKNYQLR